MLLLCATAATDTAMAHETVNGQTPKARDTEDFVKHKHHKQSARYHFLHLVQSVVCSYFVLDSFVRVSSTSQMPCGSKGADQIAGWVRAMTGKFQSLV